MLAEQTPARYVAFDLLAVDDELAARRCPSAERRAALEQLAESGIGLTPLTREPAETEPWLAHGEGVVAKELGAPYRPGSARGHGQGQAGADDRRGRRRLPARARSRTRSAR